MKISGIAKYFAVYLGSWRNFIWEVGGISFGKMAEFHLGRWRNSIWEVGGEEVVWNRGLNRSREGIQQQGGAHVRQHDHCIPTRICFSIDITYPCEPTDGRKSMLSPDLGVCIVSPNTWIY